MLRVKRLTNTAQLPSKAHVGDLAYDLYSDENVTLPAFSTTKVSTGIAVSFDDILGFKVGCKIEGRSGLAAKGIHPVGGVIDSSFRGRVQVILRNTTDTPYDVRYSDKIAQLTPTLVLSVDVMEVTSLEDTTRAESGFGSSGR